MVLIQSKVSFKQFKETVFINKYSGRTIYGESYFLIMYGYNKYGWNYQMKLISDTKDKALRAAYVFLFGEFDEGDLDFIRKPTNNENFTGYRIPLEVSFKNAITVTDALPNIRTLKFEL